ncbi:MAG: hypothetical protein COU69_03310 [Candidatus Pacebacteria bacterium CG10_big_fil_rev_8_21_14_0_10_56_10]|nr:MAG: hypothetical protein COU69_03310 [Candidatus Pacebacteria bacterium CG10_big_fil_rev_8_21_14_0_10_56_10]
MKDDLIVIPSFLKEITTDVQEQTASELARDNTVVQYILPSRAPAQLSWHFFKSLLPMWQVTKTGVLRYHSGVLFGYRNTRFLKQITLLLDHALIHLVLLLSNNKKIHKKILWIFHPYDFDFVDYFSSLFDVTLYDCTDYHALSSSVKHSEVKLIKAADIVVVNSKVLFSLHSKQRSDIRLVPQGFRLDSFVRYSEKRKRAKPKTKRLNIGYVGGINFRLDYHLLTKLIERNPQWEFTLWGPVADYRSNQRKNIDALLKLTNVTHGSTSNKDEIPATIDAFGVSIIPYNSNLLFNKYSYPMKLFEYFYMGKPVITTPIKELNQFPNFVKVGTTVREWERHISQLLMQPWPKKYARRQRQLALQNSWRNKIIAISDIVSDHPLYKR